MPVRMIGVPLCRLGGTTSICKASVSTGGTPQSASGLTPQRCGEAACAWPPRLPRLENQTKRNGTKLKLLPAGLKLNAVQDSCGFKSRRREQPIACPIWPCGPLDFQLVLVHHAEVPFAHHFMVHG